MNSKPWYGNGLRFECTRSGNCCGGAPGVVRVTDEDVAKLARHLNLSDAEFREIYTREVGENELSLKEKSNHDCVFFERENGCSVYKLRPRQCRTWPFWHHVVESPERWSEEAQHCPGMNRGPLHSAEEIDQISRDDGTFGGTGPS
ncbi:MAG: YkgJ family cysteine cluster protein [Gemmatimonadota bacterium]|nr:MAG: YkgJ family cysteine cluster protein [Gemmatimonadota bacterium]